MEQEVRHCLRADRHNRNIAQGGVTRKRHATLGKRSRKSSSPNAGGNSDGEGISDGGDLTFEI